MSIKLVKDVQFSKPTAVIIDIDNTLYDYKTSHEHALAATKKKINQLLSVTDQEFYTAYHSAREEIKLRLKNTASSHSRLLYFQRMIEKLGIKAQCLMSLDLEQTYWRAFLNSTVLFDGVKEFFLDMHTVGIPVAILTNLTAQIQFRKLIYFGIDKFIDFIVTSEEAGRDKPENICFSLLKEKMSAYDLRDAWYIGENPYDDIYGAKKNLGCFTFQKHHQGVVKGRGDEAPDVIFSHFHSLRKLVSSYV